MSYFKFLLKNVDKLLAGLAEDVQISVSLLRPSFEPQSFNAKAKTPPPRKEKAKSRFPLGPTKPNTKNIKLIINKTTITFLVLIAAQPLLLH
jgi:hypothetical protein